MRSLYRDAQGAVLVAFGLFGSDPRACVQHPQPGRVSPRGRAAHGRDDRVVRHLDRRRRSRGHDPARAPRVGVERHQRAGARRGRGPRIRPWSASSHPAGASARSRRCSTTPRRCRSRCRSGPRRSSRGTRSRRRTRASRPESRASRRPPRAPNVQLLPAPYVPIDLTSLEAAGLGSQLPNQLRTGAQVLEQLTNVSPSSRTAFVDPVDAAALASVRDLLVDRVAVRGPSIANVERDRHAQPVRPRRGRRHVARGRHDAAVRRAPRERRLSRAARATAPRRAVDACVRARGADGCGARGPGELGARCRDRRATSSHAVVGHPYVQPVTLDEPVRERAAGHERRRAGHARARAA